MQRKRCVATGYGPDSSLSLRSLQIFDRPHHARDHALRRDGRAGATWSVLHLPLTAMLLAVGMGFKLMVAGSHAAHPSLAAGGTLCIGSGVAVACTWAIAATHDGLAHALRAGQPRRVWAVRALRLALVLAIFLLPVLAGGFGDGEPAAVGDGGDGDDGGSDGGGNGGGNGGDGDRRLAGVAEPASGGGGGGRMLTGLSCVSLVVVLDILLFALVVAERVEDMVAGGTHHGAANDDEEKQKKQKSRPSSGGGGGGASATSDEEGRDEEEGVAAAAADDGVGFGEIRPTKSKQCGGARQGRKGSLTYSLSEVLGDDTEVELAQL